MVNPRSKPLIIGAIVIALGWICAWAAHHIAEDRRMTAEKLGAALRATDLSTLDAAGRARRLRDIGTKFNSLGQEERRRARQDPAWKALWANMTELEKGDFIERTMPTGFKQMITAFEQLPEEKRRSAITNTLARLQKQGEGDFAPEDNTNRPPPLTEELQKKVITTGLKTFYAESSAQTKAEMAPVLEEMQRLMESGQLFRR